MPDLMAFSRIGFGHELHGLERVLPRLAGCATVQIFAVLAKVHGLRRWLLLWHFLLLASADEEDCERYDGNDYYYADNDPGNGTAA